MTFENDKETVLSKVDKSKKGSVDQDIVPLLDVINAHPNYYTTSSCSGRIVVLRTGRERKKDSQWLYTTHTHADFDMIKECLSEGQIPDDDVWFKMESMILHVRCKDISDANRLLLALSTKGFKRSGIVALNRKIMVEIIASEQLETLICRAGKLLVSDEYLRVLVDVGNERLTSVKKKIDLACDVLGDVLRND